MQRKFGYSEIDGNHWPDADVGDDLYYSIDFNCWLETEAEASSTVEWIIPEGITSSDQYVEAETAFIQLATNKRGTFKIICKVTSVDSGDTGKEQTNTVPMMLKVFS